RQLLDGKADAGALAETRQLLEGKVNTDNLEQMRQSLEARIADKPWQQEFLDIRRRIQEQQRSIVDQQRRLALLLEEARRRLPEPLDAGQLATFSAEADHVLDAMYVSFEDDFRGTRTDIKQRLSAYLPSLPPGIGSSFAPAVDLGCGRGEWLELLQEHELTATGVDLNRIMIESCRELGLTVVETDGLTYLCEQPDNSLGLITGFHIIEHLPLRTLVAWFDEALRVLKPGGMVIFETPNPENLLVGSCNFYMDPTHRNPLPPVMTQFLVEARGFVRVEIRRMNQQNDPLQLLAAGTPGAVELNPLIQMAKEHYFAAPDYAVVAYKA
ncbi:MAG: class I SAM-dependent methyltransferase, partial [Coxiellaceae bacterium]|nr:class I SAM-dependent methyltransferase [Coxiellaceae bacterium]